VSLDGSGDDTADGVTSVLSGTHRRDGSSDPFNIDLDDLESESRSSTSFPSIHFTGSGSGTTEGSDGDGDETDADDLEMFEAPQNGSAVINVVPRTLPPSRPRTLYIQMVSSFTPISSDLTIAQEFVERQTLREVRWLPNTPICHFDCVPPTAYSRRPFGR
jgi:translation initiation factor 2-alpha kinase 4